MNRFEQIDIANRILAQYRGCRNSGIKQIDSRINQMDAIICRMTERDAESGPHGHLCVLTNDQMNCDVDTLSAIAIQIGDYLSDWNNS